MRVVSTAAPQQEREQERERRLTRIRSGELTDAKRKPIPRRAHPAQDPLGFGTPPAVPALYDGYVRRPDLVSRLRQASDYPLVLVLAPAGYAKTSGARRMGR